MTVRNYKESIVFILLNSSRQFLYRHSKSYLNEELRQKKFGTLKFRRYLSVVIK